MRVLDHLEPKPVFHYFEDLCGIPHGSRNTKAVSDYCVKFAQERGLECHQDDANNVIIIKPAAPGYEQAGAVIVQGHLDMVCEKAPDCTRNMDTEGLDLAVEGDTVFARGTTLGGDDGIAVAMALALLDSQLPMPRLEAVFTTDEEIGMLGAVVLDPAPLTGRVMLNIDSEVEGVFTVSCAGGNLTRCTLPVTRAAFAGSAVELKIGGLLGGHSGTEIDKGRANANQLMGRLLYTLAQAAPLRIVQVEGGQKDNAITPESRAVVVTSDLAALQAAAVRMEADLRVEYTTADPGLFLAVAPDCADTALPLDEESTRRVLTLLRCAPNGVQSMSADIPGLVQTSLNLGVLTTDDSAVTAAFCVRSCMASQKQMLVDQLASLTGMLGGSLKIEGDYPGWAFMKDSKLRTLMEEVYREQYGKAPTVEAIHAGLECGLFAGMLPGLDCVSIGPDLKEIHTCRERMSVASVARVWAFVAEVLRRCK